MKPVALIERALRNSSERRDIVLDPKYVDVIVGRWQDWTGGAATLEGGRRTYAELAEVSPSEYVRGEI
jgi:hypothetical protein